MNPTLRGDPNRVMREPEAAAHLGVAPITLRRWRRNRKGPRYVRLGAKVVGYRVRDVDEFVEASASIEGAADLPPEPRLADAHRHQSPANTRDHRVNEARSKDDLVAQVRGAENAGMPGAAGNPAPSRWDRALPDPGWLTVGQLASCGGLTDECTSFRSRAARATPRC
jgi:predicted DNA-binding transcriptional regulator AlpA